VAKHQRGADVAFETTFLRGGCVMPVRTHVASILKKLGAPDRQSAIRLIREH
jgi:hypothetical protein